MLSYTAIVFTILALSVDAQFSTIGTCSQEIVAASLARIPNSETCGAAIFNLTATATLSITNDDLAPLLSTVCNPDCGGRFAKFATSCGPIGDNLAYLLTLYCTPNDIVETFCHSQFPDVINQTVFDSIQACASFTPGSACPADCAAPLQSAIQQIGCCYRTLYFDLDVPTRYPAAFSALSQTSINIIDIMRQGEIFVACNTSFPLPCEGNSFTQTSGYIGICSQAELGVIFSGNAVPIDCINAGLTTLGFQSGDLTQAINTFCQADCAPVVADVVEEQCIDSAFSALLTASCLQTEGTLGNYCTFLAQQAFSQTLVTLFRTVERTCGFIDPVFPTTCTDQCRATFLNLTSALGCCYQNVYNVTEIINDFFISGNLDSMSKILVEQLRDPTFWGVCSVDLLPTCDGPSGDVKFMASFITTVMTILIALFV